MDVFENDLQVSYHVVLGYLSNTRNIPRLVEWPTVSALLYTALGVSTEHFLSCVHCYCSQYVCVVFFICLTQPYTICNVTLVTIQATVAHVVGILVCGSQFWCYLSVIIW